MKHIKQLPDIPLDLGIEDDLELGAIIADAKLAAMQQGFSERYHPGIDRFLQKQCGTELENDRITGQQLAAALLEERRKTLVAIALKTTLFTSISGLAALLVGFSAPQSAVWVFPSAIAAICTSRK
jgi:hypothetical protein